MGAKMYLVFALCTENFTTHCTFKCHFSGVGYDLGFCGMNPQMLIKINLSWKTLITRCTLKRFCSGMDEIEMLVATAMRGETLPTHCTADRLLPGMDTEVSVTVVFSSKTLSTYGAIKRFFSGMRAIMPLISTVYGENFTTQGALKWHFSGEEASAFVCGAFV